MGNEVPEEVRRRALAAVYQEILSWQRLEDTMDKIALSDFADALGCAPGQAAKILNDCGADPKFDELNPDASAPVTRAMLADVVAMRPDRVGRKAAELLRREP